MITQKQEECLAQEEKKIKELIKNQLEADFPKDSGYYASMSELYHLKDDDGPASVLCELRKLFGYARYSEVDLKLVCDEFFV